MLLFDHLFVRVLFPNRHKITAKAWRAAQPLPYQLAKVKALGVRTVINLRGNPKTPTAGLSARSVNASASPTSITACAAATRRRKLN